jgi:hypothetical protein
MHEELMEEVVRQENAHAAWPAVKRDGGALGIGTVLDRWIQQMLLQVLQAIFDPTFSADIRPDQFTADTSRK